MDFAVIGSEEFVMGFRLAGVKYIFTVEPEEYESKLLEIITDNSIGILAVDSEDISRISSSARKKALDSISPVVVQVGGEEGDLTEKVKRAIGVDLYKTERD
ncbi:V-type ATP synthase subunit F [Candidatus Methanomassiliicoccus intestinalis]|uniref:V-type ATP synthase subunit F n=1 Tax=Candidatus Methanomassiliicoccus intestinalis TaxID=1406512 RepID=UPI0037DDDEC8